ncbi:hypothetical protein ACO2Q1_11880 [Brevundimonas sp. VNH65]|uniref:hypothetical protein n=1 Tax=Brevundimonas sp. VNH65 TaxID=3400917 RepID=UPI003C0863E9
MALGIVASGSLSACEARPADDALEAEAASIPPEDLPPPGSEAAEAIGVAGETSTPSRSR